MDSGLSALRLRTSKPFVAFVLFVVTPIPRTTKHTKSAKKITGQS